MGGTFFLKEVFMGYKLFWKNLWDIVLHGATNNQITPWQEGKFINTFSINLNTANLKNFLYYDGMYT